MSFKYIKTKYRYVDKYVDGSWVGGFLTENSSVVLNESACVLQYSQSVFEGLKAYKTQKNEVVIFRPNENAKRMINSCDRLVMPRYDEKLFIDAIKKVVKANIDYIPEYDSEGSLYIRPFMFGCGIVFGVAPSKEYEFRVFTTPVGNYFINGIKPLKICVSKYDRAAVNGTGCVKAGLNYAMSIYPKVLAIKNGYDENMYLDSATRTYIEEAGGSNFIFIDYDNKVIIPNSETILPSITRKSLKFIASNYLNLIVEERRVRFDEIKNFKEGALCGTAAILTPIMSINNDKIEYRFECVNGFGNITKKLYDIYRGIQKGIISPPDGWLYSVDD